MKTEVNLFSCQSLNIIALAWYNSSSGPVIPPPPPLALSQVLRRFPSAPDFSRETSQTEMTMDFQRLIIMPLSLHNFLGIICIHTRMGLKSATRCPIWSTPQMKLPSAVTLPVISSTYLNLLIRCIKFKVVFFLPVQVCWDCAGAPWGSSDL